jgi:hypothetical protein
MVFWVMRDAGSAGLYYKRADTTEANPTFGSPVLVSSLETTGDYAWDGTVFDEVCYLAYHAPTAGVAKLGLATIDTALTKTTTTHSETVSACVAIGRQYTAGGDKLAVAWDDGTNGKWRQYNLNLTASATPTANFAAATRFDSVAVISIGNLYETYVIGTVSTASTGTGWNVVSTYQVAGTATSGLKSTRGVQLAGKPFYVKPRSVDWTGTVVYIPVFFGDTLYDYDQATYFVVDLFAQVVAKLGYQSAGKEPTHNVVPEVNRPRLRVRPLHGHVARHGRQRGGARLQPRAGARPRRGGRRAALRRRVPA